MMTRRSLLLLLSKPRSKCPRAMRWNCNSHMRQALIGPWIGPFHHEGGGRVPVTAMKLLSKMPDSSTVSGRQCLPIAVKYCQPERSLGHWHQLRSVPAVFDHLRNDFTALQLQLRAFLQGGMCDYKASDRIIRRIIPVWHHYSKLECHHSQTRSFSSRNHGKQYPSNEIECAGKLLSC
jgi:hypothetical protein